MRIMKIYGNVELSEGSDVTNLTVPRGTVYPSNPNTGELFFHDVDGLRVHCDNRWCKVTLDDNVLPQTITISGDAAGSGSSDVAITLADTGVASGTYAKVTVDTKGRVIIGTDLTEMDIPGLNWNKIISGLPTTLAGFGITDQVHILTPGQGQIIRSQFIPIEAISGTSRIPFDNTIPLITDGTQIATALVTPSSRQSRFGFNFTAMVDSNSSNRNITLVLFRNNTCVFGTSVNVNHAGRPANIGLNFVDAPNSDDDITYSIRVGSSGSGVWYLNSTSVLSNVFAGASTSTITVTEYS